MQELVHSSKHLLWIPIDWNWKMAVFAKKLLKTPQHVVHIWLMMQVSLFGACGLLVITLFPTGRSHVNALIQEGLKNYTQVA
jgi:hypothetical protein